MNKNQIKGTVQDLAGKVQEEAGKLVGSKTQQAKGIMNQVTGKAEKRLGDVQNLVHDAKKQSRTPSAIGDSVDHPCALSPPLPTETPTAVLPS